MVGNMFRRSCTVGNLLFFRRSLATRHAAVETMRLARAMPPGPERRATRRFARALSDLAKTEAWLEGQAPRRRAPAYQPERPGRVVSPEPEASGQGPLAAGGGNPRSLFGEA